MLEFDECGECGGDGIDEGACDCDGNVDLGCGCGESPAEEYYDCNGNCISDIDSDGICDEYEILGCTDSEGLNYNPDATDDDGTCYYTLVYDLELHGGANLVSFYALPNDTQVSSFFETIEGNMLGVISEGNAASISDNGWIGSLLEIEPTNGYWMIMDSDDVLTIDGYPIGTDIEYPIHQGANLISFPDEGSYSIYDVIPDELQGIIYGVLSVGTAAVYYNGEWVGSLESLSGEKGYWFKSLYDVSLTFNIEPSLSRYIETQYIEKQLDGFEYNQSSQQAFYFIDNIPNIEYGDWIVAYNDNIVVGSRQWLGKPVDIPVMGYDGYSYSMGYCDINDIPVFKLYKTNAGEIIDLYGSIDPWYSNNISTINELFDENNIIPEKIAITNVYPNPFNPITKIEFSIPESMNVQMNIIDLQGRTVKSIFNEEFISGSYSYEIDASDLASGVYFVELIGNSITDFSKIILLK